MTELSASRAQALLELVADHPDYVREVLYLVRAAWVAPTVATTVEPQPKKHEASIRRLVTAVDADPRTDQDLIAQVRALPISTATLAKEHHIPKSTISRVESGKGKLPTKHRQALREILNGAGGAQ